MEKLEKGPWETNWEKIRAKGIVKFSLLSGLALGVFPFLIKTLFQLDEVSFSELFLSADFLIGLVAWTIAGVTCFGLMTWYLNEYWYRKALAHIEDHNTAIGNIEDKEAGGLDKMSLDNLDANPKQEVISLKPKNEGNIIG